MDKELEKEVTKMVARMNSDAENESLFGQVLNSPFVLTVIGGIALTLITTLFQNMQGEQEADQLRLEQVEKQRYETMVAFADGMTRYFQIAEITRHRAIYLSKRDKTVAFSDNRSWDETVLEYEKGITELNKLVSPESLCAQVRVVYGGTRVAELAKNLDDLIDQYNVTFDLEEFQRLSVMTNESYQNIIDAMAAVL